MRLTKRAGYRLSSSRVLSPVLHEMHFPHRCALWSPNPVSTLRAPEENAGDLLADVSHDFVASDVPCFYNATPETNEATVLGRSPSNNIFVLDVFLFPEGMVIDDQWVICLLTPGDNYKALFMAQGSPLSVQPGALHYISSQKVLAMRQPAQNALPPGVDLGRV